MVSQPPSPSPSPPPQSHRIYWQQRLIGSKNNGGSSSSKNLITGSAAVKISRNAKAKDLTNLLRKTMHLGDIKANLAAKDSLVLAGTLRSVPTDYVQYEHEQQHDLLSGRDTTEATSSVGGGYGIGSTEDFHVVKTLNDGDACWKVLETMQAHLSNRQAAIDAKISKARRLASPNRRNVMDLRPTIAPQTRWYFVPDTSTTTGNSSPVEKANAPTMTSCLELDGYLTSLEDDDDDDDNDDDDDSESNDDRKHGDDDNSAGDSVRNNNDDEDLLRRALAPFLDDDGDEEKGTNPIDDEEGASVPGSPIGTKRSRVRSEAARQAREWRRYLQISQSHAPAASNAASTTTTTTTAATANNPTLCGYLLKRSHTDPHVWRRHYCVLTRDEFWYVPRLVRSDEFLSSNQAVAVAGDDEGVTGDGLSEFRTIAIAQHHGRILLAGATLLGPSTTGHRNTRSDGFELIEGGGGDGKTHRFRACSSPPSLSSGAATVSSQRSCKQWTQVLELRLREAAENAMLQHAELLVTDETLARNDRWRKFLVGTTAGGTDGNNTNEDEEEEEEEEQTIAILESSMSALRLRHGGTATVGAGLRDDEKNRDHEATSSSFRSRVLHFGLDVAEYKEGCRKIQTLLWADTTAGRSSSSAAAVPSMERIRELVKSLWREATHLSTLR